MPRKPENQFINSVHHHLMRAVYRMKNHNLYVAGIPDVWYSGSVRDLWVEYKYLPIERPRTSVVPDLSQQQLRWIKDRKNEGRNAWVIVGCKPGGVIITDLNEMEEGVAPNDFVLRLLPRKDLALQIYDFCSKEPICNREARA